MSICYKTSVGVAHVGLLLLAVCFTLPVASTLYAQDNNSVLAIKAGTVMPVTSAPIENGVILIRDGKIEAVGKDVKIPDNTEVLDATDKVVIPGLIDALTTLAERNRDDEETVTPDICAIDAFDFFGKYHRILSGGVTTVYICPGRNRLIPGYGAVVKLAADFPDQQILKKTAGLSVILGESPKNPPSLFKPPIPPDPDNPLEPAKRQLPTTRMAEMSVLRNTFALARWERENQPGQIDSKTQALLAVLDREQCIRINCHRAQDIRNALALAKAFNLKLIIEGATEAYKVVDEIKAGNCSVIVDALLEPGRPRPRDNTRDIALGQPDPKNLTALVRADIPFALAAPTDEAISDLQFIAGHAISMGLTPEQALRAVTIEPARILGIADRTGSIEKGKDADLVILTAAPFEIRSTVDRTIINGETVYSRDLQEEGRKDTGKPMLAVKAGKILTASRGQILEGLILVHDGKITYAGKAKQLPDGTEVIDASENVVIPGMIDIHSHLGLHADTTSVLMKPPIPTTGPDSSSARLASIVHAVVPDDPALSEALQSGVTSILLAPQTRSLVSGNAAVVKLAGDPFEERIVKEYAAVKFSMTGGSPKMARIWQGRDLLKKAKEYADSWDRYEQQYREYEQRKARSTPDLVKPPDQPDRDTNLELLRGLFKRQMPALVHADRDDEIRNALKVFRDEYNLDVILMGAANAYRLIPELRKYDVGIALGPDIIIYDKEEAVNNAALLTQKGLRVALHTSATSGTQYLPVSAAYAVRFGLDPDEALQSITLVPARLLHVEDRIGSIDVGKDADLVILSGEPFEFTTRVEKVIINGQVVYKRTAK